MDTILFYVEAFVIFMLVNNIVSDVVGLVTRRGNIYPIVYGIFATIIFVIEKITN